ncbi:MAG TPA: hypothetical protein VLS49_10990 [Usitatibacter sp.]|nr:hypothetical protein [Usitatibacter sp.]
MKNQKRRLLSGIEIGTLACSTLAIAFGLAYAGAQPHMLGSLFGVAPDQTVVVNVTDIGNPDLRRGLPPDPCMVQLKLFGADGSIVAQTGFLKIMPGASVSEEIKFDQLLLTSPKSLNFDGNPSANRMQVRVASYVIGGDSVITDGISHKVTTCPASQYKFLKLSTEVFDNTTGHTTFMVPADSALPAVQ